MQDTSGASPVRGADAGLDRAVSPMFVSGRFEVDAPGGPLWSRLWNGARDAQLL